ncbi:MAG: hypothetical protein AB7T49_05850 [Oligoflexales bacterium]
MPTTEAKKTKVGCLSDWSLLPLRTELEKFEPGLDLNINSLPQLRKTAISEKQDIFPELCTNLIRKAAVDLALPLGLAVKGPSPVCYFGYHSLASKMQEYINNRIEAVQDIFQKAKVNDTPHVAAAVDYILDALDDLDARMEGVIEAPALFFRRDYSLGHSVARLMYPLLFGKKALKTRLDAPPLNNAKEPALSFDVLSGNDAVVRRSSYSGILDLSAIWYKITLLPLVYLVWQKNDKGIVQSLHRQKILKAAELAQARMKVDPSIYYPDILPLDLKGHEIDLSQYWKNFHYHLDPQSMRSIIVLVHLARAFERIENTDELRVKMIRWQDKVSKEVHFT